MEEKTIDLSNRLFKLLMIVALVFVLICLGNLWYQYKMMSQNYLHQVSISGEGKELAKPDVAVANLGMRTQGDTSQEVVERNNRVMNDVVQAVKDLGVQENDIQTTYYNLMPVYDFNQMGRVFRGYSLDQQVRVKIRDFDKISEILDKAVSLGANTVGDLQFTVDDMEAVKALAQKKAIESAHKKAKELAEQSGIKLGKLINVYDSGNLYNPQPFYGMGMGGTDMTRDLAEIAPPVEPGQVEIVSNMTLVWQVK